MVQGGNSVIQLRVANCSLSEKRRCHGRTCEEAAMGSAPGVPESHRCMQGKRSIPAPDSIKLIWLCPLLLPWQVRERQVAPSGHAVATGLGEGLRGGKSWDPETPGKKGDLSVIFCLFTLRPDCCRQPALFFPFSKHIWVCS